MLVYIINALAVVAVLSLLYPLFGLKLKGMENDWIYTPGHFIIVGAFILIAFLGNLIAFRRKKSNQEKNQLK